MGGKIPPELLVRKFLSLLLNGCCEEVILGTYLQDPKPGIVYLVHQHGEIGEFSSYPYVTGSTYNDKGYKVFEVSSGFKIKRRPCLGVFCCPWLGCEYKAKPCIANSRKTLQGATYCNYHRQHQVQKIHCDVYYLVFYPISHQAKEALGNMIGVMCSNYHQHPYPPRTRPPKFITNQVSDLFIESSKNYKIKRTFKCHFF